MSAPARIAHLVLALRVGGLERVVLRLLERTPRDRFTPVVCALEEPGALAPELDRLGVPLTVIRRRPGLDPRLPVLLSRWMAREGIDLVHTHNPNPHFYGALAAMMTRTMTGIPGRKRTPRLVHTKHGRNTPGARRKVLVNRLASSLTDRVIAVSEDARKVAVEIEGVDPRRVVTILNGVDTEEFRPGDPAEARARLGLPQRGFHIGCVARLSPEKDHATLLTAFSALLARRADAHLTLIGDGALRRDLEAQAASLGITSSVTFTGMRSDIAESLPAFDVFTLTSRTEGISLTLAEAAACGLPIVATRVGGNPEIVREGETGLLVPPNDPAALTLAFDTMASRDDREALGARGRAWVAERFSAAQMARAYTTLYADVLADVLADVPTP
ncbi:glycosyltransferase family 4 protein [Chondromyces apiculatus]|uniref:Poly(Glycerol-phosphate) alpha-glucosyltransferase n=1 Tax=Chondromyces apiculatus DSM 436 TaxID=1192034 RepID=A0A017T167_9BACT|nr:glycosyltransferase [Chondromyces apiculatus]EYF02311.1 Poly(glycerol-phosphate) alpha-glucosyltransferase [Chondromyces apiculatus DSM 436]